MDFQHAHMGMPPPMINQNFSVPPPAPNQAQNIRPHFGPGKPGQPFFFKPFHNFGNRPQYGHYNFPMTPDDFDGKRLRKSVMRKTVDYNASICKALEVGNSCFLWDFIKIFHFLTGSTMAKGFPRSVCSPTWKLLYPASFTATELPGQPDKRSHHKIRKNRHK